MRKTPREVIAMSKDMKSEMIDLKFVDFPGVWQHLTVPAHLLTESVFEDGFGFDGSSMKGWQPIHNSDMLIIPDPETAKPDPFTKKPTLSLICDIADPITKMPYSRDPRHVAKKADAYLKSTGIGDIAYFGPEAEFFIFESIRFDQTQREGFYQIDSIEGQWNSGKEENPNLGYKPRYKGGYFPVPPMDAHNDLRTEMLLALESMEIKCEAQHHEVATAGQSEIDMKYEPMIQMGDNLLWFKYVVKNIAKKYNKTVTFMPKPLFEDNGSGMHVHISIWKNGVPTFAGDKYGGLSENALYAIGGILKHTPALCAFTNPTTNSYRRLVPGYEAPVNLAYSSRNRSAAIRIPMYSTSPKSKRLEFRTPDPSCNGYLAFSAILMAAIDGIINKTDPGAPLDKDIYGLPPEELANVPKAPGSLDEALLALQNDHDFLLKGDVFTQDVIDMWIDYKTKHEVDPIKLRPVPYEFMLYYDI